MQLCLFSPPMSEEFRGISEEKVRKMTRKMKEDKKMHKSTKKDGKGERNIWWWWGVYT